MNAFFKETRDLEQSNKLMRQIERPDVVTVLERAKNDVLNGDADGYRLTLLLKLIETKIKEVRAEILETVISEVENEPQLFNGYKIETTSGGRYSYAHNKEWSNLKEQLKVIEKNMQIACKNKVAMFDKETGEEIIPAEYKANKTSIKITKTK